MYNLMSFVIRSRIRKKSLENLKTPKTPTQISKILKTHRSTISRAILEMVDKNLVECLTPEENKGRLYKTTKLGEEILKLINESNKNINV